MAYIGRGEKATRSTPTTINIRQTEKTNLSIYELGINIEPLCLSAFRLLPMCLCVYVVKKIPSEALEHLIMLHSFQSFQIIILPYVVKHSKRSEESSIAPIIHNS